MSSIKVILLDYGRVVAPEDGDPPVQAVYGAAEDDVASEEVFAQYREKLAVGAATEEDVRRALEDRGVAVPGDYRQRWIDTLHAHMSPDANVLSYIAELKRKGYRVMLLSNVWPLSAEVLREEGWYDSFERVYLSCELKMRKPGAEIYEHVLQDTGLKPDEFLFVDDKAMNLEYPASVGMHVLQVSGPREVPAAIGEYLTKAI